MFASNCAIVNGDVWSKVPAVAAMGRLSQGSLPENSKRKGNGWNADPELARLAKVEKRRRPEWTGSPAASKALWLKRQTPEDMKALRMTERRRLAKCPPMQEGKHKVPKVGDTVRYEWRGRVRSGRVVELRGRTPWIVVTCRERETRAIRVGDLRPAAERPLDG
jgi:hypothetical protein